MCGFTATSVSSASSVRVLCPVCCDLSHLQTDVIAFNRSITSCEKAAAWHVAIGLVQHLTDEEMNRRGGPLSCQISKVDKAALEVPWPCDEVEVRKFGKGPTVRLAEKEIGMKGSLAFIGSKNTTDFEAQLVATIVSRGGTLIQIIWTKNLQPSIFRTCIDLQMLFQCCGLGLGLEEFPPDLISNNACLSSLGPRWRKALSQQTQEALGGSHVVDMAHFCWEGKWPFLGVGTSWPRYLLRMELFQSVSGGPYHVWCFDEHLSERLQKHEGERMCCRFVESVSCLEFRDGPGWNLLQNSGAIHGCQVINGWKAFICYSSFSGWLYNRRTTSQTKRGWLLMDKFKFAFQSRKVPKTKTR